MYGQQYLLRNPSTELYFAVEKAKKANKKDPEPTPFPVTKAKPPSDGYWFLRGREGADKGPVKHDEQVTLRWRSTSKTLGSGEDQILNMFYQTDWSGLLKTTDKTDTVVELNLQFKWKDA